MNSYQEDRFDRLPDALLLLIFNKVLDAKTLIRILSVSKRFASLVPQIDALFLSLPRLVRHPKPSQRLPEKLFKSFVKNLIKKPIRFLHHIVSPRQASNFKSSHFSYHFPNEALKNFKEIKSLHLELPCLGYEMGIEDGASLLKWKAEFGRELKSCIILGATSFQREKLPSSTNGKESEDEQEEPLGQPFVADEELKSRIMWTISCLASASVRHYLLKPIIAKCPTLQRITVTDARKQGNLRMEEEQLLELRNSMESSGTLLESLPERTPIPDLCLKLWHEPVMELAASGCVIKGLTLVLIKPVGSDMAKEISDGDLLVSGLDGEDEDEAIFAEAVRKMVKRKTTFVMEMSSF